MCMFAKFYLAIRAFIRHRILRIDDRSQLEIAISNDWKLEKIAMLWANVS